MTRAGVVTSGGDCFVFLLFYHFFDKVWRGEVDKLYINLNSAVDKKIVDFIQSRVTNPKIDFTYLDHSIGSGLPIKMCVDKCTEDLIVVLEEDGYIFEQGTLNKCFEAIEKDEYDAVGSPRGSCSEGIWKASGEKYQLDYTKYGDVGPNFWPNFFFVKRKDLLKTDLNCGSKEWLPGELIKELNLTCKEREVGDTFVWESIQLRAMGLRFWEVPQWKASPYEIENKQNRMGYWIQKPFGWLHAGSLSSGMNGFLRGDILPIVDEGNRMDFETRVSFWTIAAELEDYSEIKEFKDDYLAGIEKTIINHNLDRERIKAKISLYKELMRI